MTIDVRGAVFAAREYLKSVMALLTESEEQIKDLRLEETELSEDEKYWLITLSYDIPVPAYRDYLRGLIDTSSDVQTKYERHYKTFKIETQTGQVKSMKVPEQ